MWGVLSGESASLSFTIAAAPRQSSRSRVRAPAGLMTIFYCLKCEIPSTRRVIPPGTGFSFRRLLGLVGLWWRYSNSPRGHWGSRTFFLQLNPCGHSPCVTFSVTREWDIGTDGIENRIPNNSSIVVSRVLCRGNLFKGQLPSNDGPFWLCYSVVQATYHNVYKVNRYLLWEPKESTHVQCVLNISSLKY
jgi:hypothetical protein